MPDHLDAFYLPGTAVTEAPDDNLTREGRYIGAVWRQLDPDADKAVATRVAAAAMLIADTELESVRADLADAQDRLAVAADESLTFRLYDEVRADRDRLAATVDRSTAHVERLRELADGWVKNGQKRGIRHMISAGQILGERLDALSAPEEGSNDD